MLLSLNCFRACAGYALKRFDPADVDWGSPDPRGRGRLLMPTASATTRRVYEALQFPIAAFEGPVKVLVANSNEYETYDPLMEFSGLFMEFAEARRREGQILNFVNRYGLPFSNRSAAYVPEIKREMQRMSRAIEAWNTGIKGEDLSPFFKAFNQRVRSIITPKLSLSQDHRKASLQLVPLDLADGLWLQLAVAVEGHENYRRCGACPRYFSVDRGRGRPEKKYCSSACRLRAKRNRDREEEKINER